MANTALTAVPVVVSSDRARDIEPYGKTLFSQELVKFIDIFPSDFPQGDRRVEEEFLRIYFTDHEIDVQGGAGDEGLGFRFLKEAWMWMATYNLCYRVPAVAAHWIAENQALTMDPEIMKSVFEPDVQPSTFFGPQDLAMYGDKLLRIVVKCIQEQLREPLPGPSHPTLSTSFESSSLPHDLSSQSAMENTLQQTEPAAQALHNAGEASPCDAHLAVKPSPSQVQAEMHRTHSNIDHGKAQQHDQTGENVTSVGNKGGRQSTRGSHRSTSHGNSGSRGTRASGKPAYGPQDARYHQSPSLIPQTYGSPGGVFAPAGPSMQSRTVSAGSFAPGQTEPTPSMHPSSQFAALPQPLQPPAGPIYGYPGQGNFQVQFQHQMPGSMEIPPGFIPNHPQLFGDRSNFPNGGRSFGDESRLFDPEKPKHPKHGSIGGSLRGNKNRGQSVTQRGGNRAYNGFRQTGGTYTRDGRSSHRHAGSDFYGSAGSGQTHNDHRFNIPLQDKYWQPPYWANENRMNTLNYEQMSAARNPAPPGGGTDALVHDSAETDTAPQFAQQPLAYPRGHHQRVMSKATPCSPTECNKYSIGEHCKYAKKMVIFQVPIEMSRAAFEEYFSQYGTVEDIHLSVHHDPSQAYPGLFHRGPSWVLFADADSAREVLKARGRPWTGGPLLFAEVAGEYWNPSIPQYHINKSINGRSAASYMQPVESVAGTSSRAPNTNHGTPSRDFSLDNALTTASTSDSQKKKGASNIRKTKKYKKAGPDGETFDGACKANAIKQDGQAKRASPSDIPSKPPPDSPAHVATADAIGGKWGEEAKITTIPNESCLSEEVVDSCKPASISATADSTSPSMALDETKENPSAVFQAAPSEQILDQVSVEHADDQVDDSFHTAEAPHEDRKETTNLDDGMSVTATNQGSSGDLAPGEIDVLDVRQSLEAADVIRTTTPVDITDVSSAATPSDFDSSALVSDACVASAAAQETSEQNQSTPTAEAPKSTEVANAPMLKRSVTIVIPPVDAHDVATPAMVGCETVQTAQARSASGDSMSDAPAPSFVTAPSTPAVTERILPLKSKKVLKSKGPAQTESLSLFAKPKSRKSSTKKTKHAVESSSKQSGAINTPPHGEITPLVSQFEHLVMSAATREDDKAEGEQNAPGGSDGGACSQSSYEPLSGSTWTVKAITNTAKAIMGMAPAISPVPQVTNSVGLSADGNQLSEKTRERHFPSIQLDELGEDVPEVEKMQDSTEPLSFESATGLGISHEVAMSDTAVEQAQSPDSDEGKPKKKKVKAKSKSKRSKATAVVTIASNITVGSKPNEPIHEFRGNDATSDSSSQTFGRTSPVFRRPSLKQIDEAKQPKPLLEPRASRQNRNKKHISVHGSKNDGTDSTEETAVANAENGSRSLFLILTPHGNGTFVEEPSEAKNAAMAIDSHALHPVPTPDTPKSIPTPEKPWDRNVPDEAPSPLVEQSKERIRQMDEEAAQKKKFA